jgi:hypothetical protein
MILYRQRVAITDNDKIPVKINQALKRRKNTWNLQCKKLFKDWDIVEESCPTKRKALKMNLSAIEKVSGGDTSRESNNTI